MGYNFYCISKKYFFNSSLFKKNILLNFHNLFSNNRIGFIGLNREFKELSFDITKTYTLTDINQQYITIQTRIFLTSEIRQNTPKYAVL